jgi:hypothetical protein
MRRISGIPLAMTNGNRSDEPIAYRNDAVSASRALPIAT